MTIADAGNHSLTGAFSIGNEDSITLIWNGTQWIEISRANN
jgi:hypothetical protein